MLPRLQSEPPSGKHRESERTPERQKEGEYLEERREKWEEIKCKSKLSKQKVQKCQEKEIKGCRNGHNVSK